MTTSIPTDQIDQTHRALAATQPSLLTLPFRLLPAWAMVALALVGACYAKRLLVIYQLHAKAERYRLERRRKAGIPDSDKREFRLAAAEVLRARKVEDERRELERAMRKRAGRFKSDWERLGAVNGMRERPSQQLDREDSMTPSIFYSSLAPQARPVGSPSAFAFDDRSATPAGPHGDSDDERRELILREKSLRRARGEGFGDEPILARSSARPSDSPAPRALTSSRSAPRRSHASATESSQADDVSEEDGVKRPKVKQEPMSDDVDLALAHGDSDAPQQLSRTRKRDDDDEDGDSADERGDEEEEDGLMSSGSERLVRPPVRRAPRKKIRRRQRSVSIGSGGESRSEAASDAEMGSAEDASDDDDDRSMSSGSRSPLPPSPPPAQTQRSAKKLNKRVLSEVGSVSSSRPRPSLAKKRRKSNGTVPAPISEDEVGESPKPATRQDSWEDPHGIKFRTGANGRGSERLVLVKKQVRKFDMPADSEHPDREQTIAANIEQWVNEREFAQLRARRALAWQSDEEEGAEPAKVLEQADQSVVDGVNTVLFNSSSLGRSAARKGTLYVAKNASGTPLRPSQSLIQMHELYTSSGLFSTASSRPATPSSSTVGTPKAAGGGKLRFSSAAARIRGSPFSASLTRQAKEAEEQNRLDEELARKVEEEKKAAAVLKPAPALAPAPAPAPTPAPTQPVASSSASTPASASGSPFSFGGPSKDSPTPTLAPTPKPPAGAANPFAASTSSAPAQPSSELFGAKPAASSQQPAAEVPKPASSGFSFGAPAKPTDAPAPAAAPKATFSFGAPPAAATPVAPPAPQPIVAKAPAFAFAAPSASTTPAPSTPAEAPKAPSFSFGAPSAPSPAPSVAPPAATASSSFSFGAGGTQRAPDKPTLSTQPSFSFGAASTTPATPSIPAATAAPAPSFAFGSNASSSAPSFGAAVPSFGGGSSSSAPKFSFGASTTPAASPAAPTFGGANTPGAVPAPFSFGAKPADGAAPAAPKASFSFGGGGSGGFSFGK